MKVITPHILLFLLFFSMSPLLATDYTVSSADEFNNLSLQPCDVVTWTNGTYVDQEIDFNAQGESGSPIVLRAETPGGVVFTGGSKINMWGDYLVVDGFYWNEGEGFNNHIEFRRSGSNTDFANHSIFRNCAFNNLFTEGDNKSRWIVMYGTDNTIENCSFLNKDTTGVCILVELEYAISGQVNHQITNNYFYNVTNKDGRENSGDSEGIRIGSSEEQTVDANVLVANNYFQEVDGENEIISNKSFGNVFVNNTFRNSRGSLVLRHGAQAYVEGNYFIGQNKANSGGIRVSDRDHIIINNYMQELDNSAATFNNGITLMGGDTPSGGTSNGYQYVDNVLIAFNTIYNSDDPIYYNDERGSYVPEVTFANNLIYSTNGTIVSGDISGLGDETTYIGNIFGGSTIGVTDDGITNDNSDFSADGEIFKPSTTGPVVNAAEGTYNEVFIDIQGLDRPTTGKDVGAHEVVGGTGMPTHPIPIIDAEVGNGIGACYLDASGMVSNTDCMLIDYGDNCMPISVTGVEVTPSSSSIIEGNSQQLVASVLPVNATNTDVTWESDNPSIATVDENGLVIAVAPGTTIITAITVDGGFTDTANIEVLEPLTPPDCVEGTNLALESTIIDFSDEQEGNPVSNRIDGDDDNRWSAMPFPQWAIIDLGDTYNVGGINLIPFQERDYQYLVEGSLSPS